jgi:hypothetical protein
VVVEVADLVEAGYIVEIDHIAGIEEKKGVAEDTQQERMIGIVGKKRDIVGLVLPVDGDS